MNKITDDSKDNSPINIEVLQEMNRELRAFIEHSLSSEFFWEKWTDINFSLKRINCWEIKNCGREDCPSYRDADGRCWLKVGTLQGREAQDDVAKKFRRCFSCEVLRRVEDDVLRALSENINILIHHLRIRDKKLISNAFKDQLTGAFSRAYFNEYMGKRLAQAGRYQEHISFIMLDLDGFKALNDIHGHQAGDAVLAESAVLLHRAIRQSDLLFRYGGDEFLIVLPLTDCDRAELVKERIQAAVHAWNHEDKRYESFRLSLSMGCSTWKRGDELLSKIQEADAMMYRAKREKKGA